MSSKKRRTRRPAKRNQETRNILVIGFGNTLRCDDGLGPRVAEAVGNLRLAGVRTLICHQLAPEHAEPISRVDSVIFVDAAVDGRAEVRLSKLESIMPSEWTAHAASPASLLALARDVYDRVPQGWLLAIPAANLEFGEALSPIAQKGMEAAIEQIRVFCGSAEK